MAAGYSAAGGRAERRAGCSVVAASAARLVARAGSGDAWRSARVVWRGGADRSAAAGVPAAGAARRVGRRRTGAAAAVVTSASQ
jgi:hypothetical protein